MKTSESILKIAPALLKAQRKIGGALKDSKNPFFKSNYSDLGSVMEATKVPLNEEGILVVQNVFSDNGFHFVETILLHESGEWFSSGAMKLELGKVDMQQAGAACTYAKRYQLQSMTFVPSVDDDGESLMNRKPALQRPTATPLVNAPPASPAMQVTPSDATLPQQASASLAEVPKSRTTFRKPPPAAPAATPVAPSKNLNF